MTRELNAYQQTVVRSLPDLANHDLQYRGWVRDYGLFQNDHEAWLKMDKEGTLADITTWGDLLDTIFGDSTLEHTLDSGGVFFSVECDEVLRELRKKVKEVISIRPLPSEADLVLRCPLWKEVQCLAAMAISKIEDWRSR